MKHLFKRLSIFILSLVLFGAIASCSSGPDTIHIGQGDWESNEFHDQVVSYIIEEGYGVETSISSLDTPVIVQSLKTGDVDLNTEIWTDNIPTYRDDIEAGYYHELSINYDDNMQGIYIPQYLADEYPGLRSVQDLPDYASIFPTADGGNKPVIYGGPSGWEITSFLESKVESYGLDEYYEFRPLESTATLNATLVDAYNQEEAWLGYNWEPTWIMGQLDMYLLEDEVPFDPDRQDEGIGMMPAIEVAVVVTDGFREEYPEITAFLTQYQTSSEITSDALSYMEANDASAEETAIWWLYTHQEIWTSWVNEDALDSILTELDNDYDA